jgi:chloramphenicol O-acetyltransferase type B
MIKKMLIRIYTYLQVTFLYSFKSRGKNLRLGKNLFIYKNRVSVKDNVYIGQNSYLDGEIEIGNNVLIASYVAIVGGDHKFDVPNVPIRDTGREHWKKTTLCDNCWIGHGAILLNGITIGSGSIVAAGSIVTKSVPPNTIVGGNPARTIRNIF